MDARFDGDSIVITNNTIFDAEIKLMTENNAARSSMLGLYWQEKMRLINVDAGKSVTIPLEA